MKKVKELFYITNGNGLALSDLTEQEGGYNFISRGEKNNGVVATVKKVEGIEPFDPNKITVSLGGSVLESFYQDSPFYTAYHIKVLTPKVKMTQMQMFFYCDAIRHNKYRYSYGRQANKTLDELLIPSIDEIPKWVENFKIPQKPNADTFHNKIVSLNDRKWEWFNISSIFDKLEKCKCTNASKMLVEGSDIDYIGAKKNENGFMYKVKKNDDLTTEGNCIVFIGDGQGSVGYTTYQPKDFIGSSTLTVGYNHKLNVFNSIFLISIFDREKYRYSFGRKLGKQKLENQVVKLPVDSQGYLDWDFMEYYIKSLPYSKNLKEESKTYEKPLYVDMGFDEMMERLTRVDKTEVESKIKRDNSKKRKP